MKTLQDILRSIEMLALAASVTMDQAEVGSAAWVGLNDLQANLSQNALDLANLIGSQPKGDRSWKLLS